MQYHPTRFDFECSIRKATKEDTNKLIKFIKQLDAESDYLLYEPKERLLNFKSMDTYLSSTSHTIKDVVYIAEYNNNIIGFICGEAYKMKRKSHIMKLNIGILLKYRKTDISRRLAQAIGNYIQAINIKRVEATVIKNNKLSYNLCRKFGLEIEGVTKSSIQIGTHYYDELILSKIL